MNPQIANYRLPTHGRSAHKFFYDGRFLFQNANLSKTSFVDDAMKQSVIFLSY